MMIKIVHDELTQLMGGDKIDINIKINPAVILIAGLQGSGKTTFSGKLAKWVKTKRSKNPLLVARDVYRPAAIEQLKVIGSQVETPVYTEAGNMDPVAIARNSVKEAKKNGHDLVIIDTAGRLAVDEAMMNEVAAIKQAINPSEILFVVDSMTGQDAVNVAKTFDEKLGLDGIIVTKLDSDTRGGAVLSVKKVTGKPVKYVGMGEKMEDLEVFHPERMASRILGMGDVLTLIDQAQQAFDDKEAEALEKKLRENSLDLEDFLQQMQQIKKMGNIKDLLGMMPGIDQNALAGAEIDEKAMVHMEAIIQSMTRAERQNPDILNGSRKRRIAAGSGRTIQEINRLLKQFEQMRKMMKGFSGAMFGGKGGKKGLKGLMGKMGNLPFFS
jgi:signal recognition particle subunit SRP54